MTDRLIEQRTDAARALTAFDAGTAPESGAEERAWAALQGRLAQRRRPWAAAGLVAAAAAGLLIWAWPGTRTAAPDPGTARANRSVVVVKPALPATPRLLPVGRSRLGGVLLTVAPGTRAEADGTTLVLDTGSVELAVTGGARPTVVAGGYRFVDLGTVFRVARREGRVDLWVDEGRVDVWRQRESDERGEMGERVATVAAGGHWSPAPPRPAKAVSRAFAVAPHPAPLPAGGRARANVQRGEGPVTPAPPVEPPGPSPRAPIAAPQVAPPAGQASASPPAQAAGVEACEGLGAGEALACYRRLAGGDALTAETALYAEARLLGERLHDAPGAVAALLEHRRRFPGGALETEVDLSLVELLPRLGRYREALETSQTLLARHPGHERAAELHVVRGNILREVFHDCGRAEREYAAARLGQGAAADDGAFFEAVCLEARSRADAAAAYRRYLAGPAARHGADARARLSALGQ
jgi:hypothetical protein